MFTRRAKEKPQLRVLKFWEGFSSTSSAPWRPSAPPSTARAGLWVVGSCQLFLPQVILDRVLRWHHPDHPRHHSPALKVCHSLHSHHLQVKALGLSSFETILHGLTAKPRSGRPFPLGTMAKTGSSWAFPEDLGVLVAAGGGLLAKDQRAQSPHSINSSLHLCV